MPKLTAAATARSWLRRALRKKDGATTLEFAMVIGPFLLMLFAVLEVTLIFFVTSVLETATNDVSRRIRTGELQLAGSTAEDFKDDLCQRLSALVQCEGNVHVDSRVFSDFDQVSLPSPVEDGEFDPGELEVSFGEAGDVVIVRAYLTWNTITPDLGIGLSNLNGGRRLIVSSAAFRNEPFGAAP